MNYMYTIAVVLILVLQTLGQNPLSNCDGGRGVPYTFAASGGTCGLPTIGIPAAEVDQAFFDGGLKCGVCYQVTGPLGVQTVQILDSCSNTTGTGTCTGSLTNFGIDEATFSIIANRSTTDIIYDLGFREVTCDVTGNVLMKIGGPQTAQQYYFSLQFWNFRVGITSVRIKGSGWNSYDTLSRQGSTGTWAWNKGSNVLKFPVTIYLVGVTNELITQTVSSMVNGTTVDFGSQFADVAGDGTTDCPLNSSPAVIYNDSISYGWNAAYSFNPFNYNPANTSSPFSGTAFISVGLYEYGGLQFTRLGGFNPQYFSYLTFAARADDSEVAIKVYMGTGLNLSYSVIVGTEWAVYNISVANLTTSDLEDNLVFLNSETYAVQLDFDAISWQLSPTSPLDDVPLISTTGGGYVFNTSTTGSTGIVIVDTTGTTGFTFESTGHSGASSLPVNFLAVVGASLLTLACMW